MQVFHSAGVGQQNAVDHHNSVNVPHAPGFKYTHRYIDILLFVCNRFN